jgi:hypothetical protein
MTLVSGRQGEFVLNLRMKSFRWSVYHSASANYFTVTAVKNSKYFPWVNMQLYGIFVRHITNGTGAAP